MPKFRVRLVDDQGSSLRFVFLQIKVLTEHETCIHYNANSIYSHFSLIDRSLALAATAYNLR